MDNAIKTGDRAVLAAQDDLWHVAQCECPLCQEFGQLPTISYEEGVKRAERDRRVAESVRAARASNHAARIKRKIRASHDDSRREKNMTDAIKTGDRVVLAAIDGAGEAKGTVRDVDGNRVLVRTNDGGTEWVDAKLVSRVVTYRDIEQLSEEAGAAGDSAQLALCIAALTGDDVARAECERVILAWRREAGIRAEEDAVSAEALDRSGK